ncbi:hypothetical protein BH10PSE17_BH10PSE17_01170 [soil metagenome]
MDRQRFWRDFNVVMGRAVSTSGISRQHFVVECAVSEGKVTAASIKAGGTCRRYPVSGKGWAQSFLDDAANGVFGPPHAACDVRA